MMFSAYEFKYWVEAQIANGNEIDPNLMELYEKLDENDSLKLFHLEPLSIYRYGFRWGPDPRTN